MQKAMNYESAENNYRVKAIRRWAALIEDVAGYKERRAIERDLGLSPTEIYEQAIALELTQVAPPAICAARGWIIADESLEGWLGSSEERRLYALAVMEAHEKASNPNFVVPE
ncbi:MAG: hypothetical protein QM758_13630 [Armatimonas sp.]